MDYLARLFGVSNYMPHGYCFHWRPDLLLLHAGSDLLTAISYFSIPAAIIVFFRKRTDAPGQVAKLFIAFIALCGLTHLMSVVVIWYPAYALEGLIKLATALVSMTTAIVLWPLIPKLSSLPSRSDLEARNRQIEQLNAKLQQRIDSLGTLAGGVSHDFNNLLTVIKGHAQILQESADTSGSQESLSAISSAAERATDVCRQMLAYSGRGHFVLEEADLNELIEALKLPDKPDINFNYSLSTRLPHISASPQQIEQLLTDLCTNAIEAIDDASTERGEISISTWSEAMTREALDDALFSHEVQPGEVVLLEVADNGVGMPPKVLERLFEPYYSTKFTGRGLGMAAVQGIVRGHHGCIFIDTAPGKGTRVRVAFPTTHARSTRYRPPRTNRPRTILIVDDEPQVLALARDYLSRLGIETLATSDSGEALRLARRHRDRLDAIIVDFLLPYTTGSELLVRLLEICEADAYLTSGYSRGEIDDPTLRRVLTGFIAKPFDPEDFRVLFAAGAVEVN